MKILRLLPVMPFIFLMTACMNSGAPCSVKTNFQTSSAWREEIDVRSDGVMVYGTGKNFEDRVHSWREKGYDVQFMTGIAWGGYQDYFTGEWDGKMHLDEAQVREKGDTIWHGRMVPYIVPTDNFVRYMEQEHIRRVIDSGITDIVLEEPEFWADAGYSDAFKKEWSEYYGFDWKPQHESPDNTYLSNKLKYHLYYDAIDKVCTFAKEYGRQKGLDIKCYIATHSLVNYTKWKIVSPEASLASLDCIDGYIAQVWTGTARSPYYFNGARKEMVFETAFLEYGCMESMTSPTGRKVYFLSDPIEDGVRDWDDYKRNYQATFTAELMYPDIADFEVMPWPERIYMGKYRTDPDSDEWTTIPRHYSTQVQLMVNALNKMPASANKVSGSRGISVLMANSMMFQRFPEHASFSDPECSNFSGLCFPFLKRGIPVQVVHMENLGFRKALSGTKVLLMSYSDMKPMDPVSHSNLAEWVRKGGIIVYCSRDDDPFQYAPEWWNSGDNGYLSPSDHLFELMGIEAQASDGIYCYGKGKVCIIRQNPKEFAMTRGGDGKLVETVGSLYGKGLEFKNSFYLERGMYDIASVMTESTGDEPLRITGKLIDLYDHNLPVIDEKVLRPGEQTLLIDVNRIKGRRPRVLASASREYDECVGNRTYSFTCKSPSGTSNVMRVFLPEKPESVTIDGIESISGTDWDSTTSTALLRFDNSPEGVDVIISW